MSRVFLCIDLAPPGASKTLRRGCEEVAKRSRRCQLGPGSARSGSISAHFRAVWLRFWLPVGAFSRGFGNYGVSLGSEKNPFSDRFCKWFQHRLPGGSTPFGGEPENHFLTFLKAIPFQTGSNRAPRDFRPGGASKPLILDKTCRNSTILHLILAERY